MLGRVDSLRWRARFRVVPFLVWRCFILAHDVGFKKSTCGLGSRGLGAARLRSDTGARSDRAPEANSRDMECWVPAQSSGVVLQLPVLSSIASIMRNNRIWNNNSIGQITPHTGRGPFS